MLGRCLHCRKVREVGKAWKKVGGDYRRAPRSQRCNICLDCANTLVAYANPGQRYVSRWSVADLNYLLGIQSRETPLPEEAETEGRLL